MIKANIQGIRLILMRVLLLTTEVGGRGGVQYAGRLMLRAMRDCLGSGARLALVTVADSDAQLQQLAPNVRIFGGGGSRLRTGLAAVRLLRRETWDVLVLGHLNLAALVLAAGRGRLPPILAFIHGLEAWKPLSRLRRRGLRRADRVLYNSQHTQQRSLAANPWLASLAAELCPLGLLPAELEGGSANGARDCPTESFALAIGRMARAERYKGFEELIRAWPLVERWRSGFPLVLIGDGDDRARLEALALTLRANVRFFGSVSNDVRDVCLENCTCFCLPSRGEGLGLVYLQAMRAGKAVLAGSGDAGAEVVLDGQTGRTVDPANADELVRGLVEVSGEKASAMGRAGRDRFHALFGYDRFLDRFARHLREVSGVRGVCSA